jgi:hypothetical protein
MNLKIYLIKKEVKIQTKKEWYIEVWNLSRMKIEKTLNMWKRKQKILPINHGDWPTKLFQQLSATNPWAKWNTCLSNSNQRKFTRNRAVLVSSGKNGFHTPNSRGVHRSVMDEFEL